MGQIDTSVLIYLQIHKRKQNRFLKYWVHEIVHYKVAMVTPNMFSIQRWHILNTEIYEKMLTFVTNAEKNMFINITLYPYCGIHIVLILRFKCIVFCTPEVKKQRTLTAFYILNIFVNRVYRYLVILDFLVIMFLGSVMAKLKKYIGRDVYKTRYNPKERNNDNVINLQVTPKLRCENHKNQFQDDKILLKNIMQMTKRQGK